MKKENNTGGYPCHRLQTDYMDLRHFSSCIYCGCEDDTRDHVPPKIFLDKPYPPDLPVVPACRTCNVSFSEDDLYVACLIECAKHGSSDPRDLSREKIKEAMTKQCLVDSLARAKIKTERGVGFKFDGNIVYRVFVRLARAHALFELCEMIESEDLKVEWFFLEYLSADQRNYFETPPEVDVFPEGGSRAMQRLLVYDNKLLFSEWVIVEQGNYRYLAMATRQGILIRIVIHELLAVECLWP